MSGRLRLRRLGGRGGRRSGDRLGHSSWRNGRSRRSGRDQRLPDARHVLGMDDRRAFRSNRRVHVPAAVLGRVDVEAEIGVKAEPGIIWRAVLRVGGAQAPHQRHPVDRVSGSWTVQDRGVPETDSARCLPSGSTEEMAGVHTLPKTR